MKKCTSPTRAGKALIPCPTDFTGGMQNDTLEISAGDRILVTYADEQRLENQEELQKTSWTPPSSTAPSRWPTRRSSRSTNERHIAYKPGQAGRAGDQLMVIVTEYDEDVTDERDTVDVTVRTSRGETLTVKALETCTRYGHRATSGTSTAAVPGHPAFGAQTGGDTIKVEPGDKITASYLDKENTRPGIPVERQYSLYEAGLSKPRDRVYRTGVTLVEDKSEAAQAKLAAAAPAGEPGKGHRALPRADRGGAPRLPGGAGRADQRAGGRRRRPAVSVAAPRCSLRSAYPRMALHAGSILTVTAVSETELAAAPEGGARARPAGGAPCT